ncbi:alpha/beta hydrolase family protein [Maribacter luteus]|uniref:Dipeptidyl aminopeptidase n=1 Tax=Maribacter luteus TaxID=2594478 RepID=A0A6I2MRB7_9FLAO|nr:acetylxylan esterase [Maribacter luteus]MRX65382.1 dipeptidyl aminopeptidase [Maribacter luteus]
MKLKFSLWLLLIQVLIGYSQTNGLGQPSDLFGQYLTMEPPEIIKDLGEENENGVKLRKVIFHSYFYNDKGKKKNAEIFAAIARPAKDGKYPGLLALHGGAGYAEIDRAKKWAALGYIVVVLDEPGVADPDKIPMSHGPWENYKYGENRFVVKPDLKSSTLFSAVLASVQGLYLLNSQSDVIKDKIGITGVSWGGYLTTFISGLANSTVTASFSVFGSGFYDEGSTFLKYLDSMSSEDRSLWLQYLDAGRVTKNIKTPFFIAAAANDNWFYPPAVSQTLNSIKGNTNHLFAPNNSHKIELPGGTQGKIPEEPGWLAMERVYFEYYLKGIGKPLPKITKIKTTKLKKGKIKVRFKVNSILPVEKPTVSVSQDGNAWPKKIWDSVDAENLNNGWFEVIIPREEAGGAFFCFASISDSRPVTVSSKILRIN